MAFWSSEKDTPRSPEKQLAESVDELMKNRDLFGVADLLCKQSPEMVRKIIPEIGYTTSLQLKNGGDFDLKIGGYNGSKSVTVGSDSCVDWGKK
ncbi:MAG: hypothetical protein QG625_3602 [Cyanobacteriota bacterium erpe_2018_sw_39hr_WHONDRS-SW48-000098_B_bin.30]|jgi:hypothetical protein|nr:hypothetical protein [Cyanobacteriota bacterium erpe_2018_sw_39hr_WHONDRS-SW48-000098_B_bin.30]